MENANLNKTLLVSHQKYQHFMLVFLNFIAETEWSENEGRNYMLQWEFRSEVKLKADTL